MALFYAATFVTGTVAGGANGVGAPNGTGTTTTGNTNWTGQWTMSALGGTVSGTTPVSVWAKKEAGQSGTPSMVVTVTSSTQGTIFTSASTNVTATTFTQINLGNITATGDLGTLTMDISATSAGGSPTVRTTIQVDAMAVDATVAAAPIPKTANDTGSFSVTEAVSFAQSAFTRTETGTVSATEAVSFGTSAFSSTDTGTLSATETSSVSVILSSTDSGSVSATETSDVQSILSLVSSSDSGTITAFEGYINYVNEAGSGDDAFYAYHFDENTGTTSANQGTGGAVSMQSIPGWTTGHTNSAMTSNNTAGATLVLPADAADWTLMAWFKPRSTGTYASFIESPNSDFWLEMNGLSCDLYTSAVGFGLVPGSAFTSDVWVHIAVVSQTGVGTKLVVNGTTVDSAATVTPLSAGTYEIGGSASQPYQGETDDFRYYQSALSDAQITTAMGTPVGTGGPATETYYLNRNDWGTVSGADAGTVDGGATPITANDSGTITGTDASSAPVNILVDKSASDAGTFTGTDASSTVVFSGLWPTSVSANNRYLLDQNGDPWPLRGFTIWSFPVRVGQNEGLGSVSNAIEGVMNHLESENYNCVLMSAFGSATNGGPSGGDTWDGISPFTTGTTFNETYWTRMDEIIDVAATHGITIMLDVLDAWIMESGQVLQGLSTAEAQSIGTQIGNRYKDKPNIIWAMGGDYFGNEDTAFAACLTNIQATGDTHLITVDYYAESSSYVDSGDSPPSNLGRDWADFGFIYTYNASYLETERSYEYTIGASPTTRPVIYCDGIYEPPSIKVFDDQLGWTLTSGSPGYLFGATATWAWGAGAYTALTTGTWSNGHGPPVLDYLTSRPDWELLIPDLDESLNFLTSARGTKVNAITSGGGNGEYSGGNTYLTGAVTPSGSLAVIYTPTARTFTIDESQMAANYTATWLDPTDGTTSAATPGSSYTTPGNNGDGNTNWYLVLEEDTSSATKSANDSGEFSATDSATVVVIYEEKSASDTGAISATDTAALADSAFSSTDSGSVSAVDTALDRFVFVDPAGAGGTATDSGDIVASESASITSTLSVSDSGIISATEATSILVEISTSDSGTLSATDTASISGDVTASDAGSISATEGGSFGQSTPTANDTGTITGADAGSVVVVYDERSANDTGTLSVTESTLTAADANSFDTGTVSAAESASSSGTVTSSDTGTLSGIDAGSFNQTPINANDSGTLSATDAATVVVVYQEISANDSGSVTAAEIASSGGTGIGSDTGSVAAAETASTLSTSTRTDTGTLSVTESAEVGTSRSGNDSGTLSVTETTDVVISGGADKVGSDTGTLSATAEISALTITQYVVAGDSGTLQATETAASAGTVNTSDAGTVTAVDGAIPTIGVPASDSGTLSATEGSAVVQFEGVTVNVWNGTQFVVGRMRVWDGTQFIDPVVRVWNGSGWVLYP